MIETTYADGVAVLTMRHGKVNALDTALCQALRGALDQAADRAQAVVLTGTGTVFSAGVDLHQVIAGRDAYLASFLPELRRVFTSLATFELPLVAAVNGHAIAGGYILAAAADQILMAEGPGRAGVTELLVGVPFPAIALELLRMRVGDVPARPLITSAATFQAGPALTCHLIDEAVPAGDLASRSVTAARQLAALGPAFRLTKRQLRLLPLARAQELASLDADVDATWKAPPTLDRIRSYLASLKPAARLSGGRADRDAEHPSNK